MIREMAGYKSKLFVRGPCWNSTIFMAVIRLAYTSKTCQEKPYTCGTALLCIRVYIIRTAFINRLVYEKTLRLFHDLPPGIFCRLNFAPLISRRQLSDWIDYTFKSLNHSWKSVSQKDEGRDSFFPGELSTTIFHLCLSRKYVDVIKKKKLFIYNI